MRYKKIILAMGIVALAILYGIYKFSPIISQSLESEGFKLISNAQNKEVIYKRMLVRHKDDINKDIKLDEFLISKEQKWVALSFWCDVEMGGKKFFVSLNNHKKYCVMGVVDYLIDEKQIGIGDGNEDEIYVKEEFFSKILRYEEFFRKLGFKWEVDLEKNKKFWINWCKLQKYSERDILIRGIVQNYCLSEKVRSKLNLKNK